MAKQSDKTTHEPRGVGVEPQDRVIERKDSGTATLNVRIDRETVANLRGLAASPNKLGAEIEKLVAGEVARRHERKRISEAVNDV